MGPMRWQKQGRAAVTPRRTGAARLPFGPGRGVADRVAPGRFPLVGHGAVDAGRTRTWPAAQPSARPVGCQRRLREGLVITFFDGKAARVRAAADKRTLTGPCRMSPAISPSRAAR